MACKHCQLTEFSKAGFVRGKQRYQCKSCRRTFVEGDARTNEKAAAKAMCVVLYSLAKTSYGMFSKIFGRDCSLIYCNSDKPLRY